MSCDNCSGRIAVQLKRIFNGATLTAKRDFMLALSGFTPSPPTYPLTFISARGAGEATVTSQTVTRIANSNRSRVRLTLSYPVTVFYTDASGVRGRANAVINDDIDLLLVLPDTPYTIEVDYSFGASIGSIADDGTVTMSACRKLTVKVLTRFDAIICVNGCVEYPQASLTEDAVCSGLTVNNS